MNSMRKHIYILAVALMLPLAGCADSGLPALSLAATDGGAPPAAVSSLPAAGLPAPDEGLVAAKAAFRDGDFGLAEQRYRKLIEARPEVGEYWLGLAATYDELHRFDLADQSYSAVLRISGPTVEVLNNRGYSYMTRGRYKEARKDLQAALAREPDNSFVQANLALLAERSKHQPRKRPGKHGLPGNI